MRPRAEDIARVACKLPARDRVRVVERLLLSLEPEAELEVDAAWAAEIGRRSAEIDAGRATLLTWSDVKRRARKRSRGRA